VAGTASAVVLIDSFGPTGHGFIVTGPPSGFLSGAFIAATALGEAVGDEREIYVERTSANEGTVSGDADMSLSGRFAYSSGIGTTGNALLTWDGADVSTTLAPTGLGSVDLTQAGANNSLHVSRASDLGATLVFTVYTDGSNYSTFSLGVPANPFVFSSSFVPFAGFTVAGGTGADFTDVGAITLQVLASGIEGTDVGIDFFEATFNDAGSVPEPGVVTLRLVGGALAGIRRSR